MRKLGLKLVVSFLTFVIGVCCVYFFYSTIFSTKNERIDEPIIPRFVGANQNLKILDPTSPNGKVALKFTKFTFINDRTIVEFDAINHNSKSAFYWAEPYIDADGSENLALQPQFKLDGVSQQILYCGTGLKKFELKAGESRTISLGGQTLNMYLEKAAQNIQIGYWFGRKSDKSWKIIWSETLQIPNSVKAQLKKEKIELKNNNQ